ncbi:Probable ATP-dependent RNA helicase DDX10 [Strongyloides ratti]|uniref:ATP-dependent RNA helicase n=1 Tax=Strongyloides ratti TaxID=34506 RepID=A0A090L884_STRRB|nr:Probable ATP-dependent RNA helicase DDX10 [Strongyloides ratti]CEF65962.1 Probable ATP-dependent RNA helicase DDX10 [Strongyloides ratti]
MSGNVKKKFKAKVPKEKGAEKKEIAEVLAKYEDFDQKASLEYSTFSQFPMSKKTLEGLEEGGFINPTDIQRQSLGYSLTGKDIVGAAKTGSGKTLAFIIPILECLWKNRWSKTDGLGALILTPTRELGMQIFKVLNAAGKKHDFSVALLIGGTDVNYEKKRLGSMNILIATPGRLLQHMDENIYFQTDQLQVLVIDEADRMMDLGFKNQMTAIIENIPKDRQTMLFSATQTTDTQQLIQFSLKDPVYVRVHDNAKFVTPDNLIQKYCMYEEEEKYNFLWSFIHSHREKKILVFVTCCKQARFYVESLKILRIGLPILGLYGTMNQNKRTHVFQNFDRINKGAVLICTDIASRGLDFANIDWVLQLDCPSEISDYIHRVGRTARNGKKGEALLVLTKSQVKSTLVQLKARNIPISKMIFDPEKIIDMRRKLQVAIVQEKELKDFAQKSFVSYLKAIYSMKDKTIFDVTSINFKALSESYGLVTQPRVRFLDKRIGKQNKVGNSESVGFDEFVNNDSDEDGDIFSGVKTNIQIDDAAPGELDAPSTKVKTKDVMTKIRAAKQTLKAGILPNKRIVFDSDDDEGHVVVPQSDKNEISTFDIEEAKREMKEISSQDQKAYREKRKLKKLKKKEKARKAVGDAEVDLDFEGSESDGGSVDLSWLPDPDKKKRVNEFGEIEYEDEDEEIPNKKLKLAKVKKRKLESDEEKALALLGL